MLANEPFRRQGFGALNNAIFMTNPKIGPKLATDTR